MKSLLRRTGVHAVCACLVLSGCVTDGSSGLRVGPLASSVFDPAGPAVVDPAKHRLDVIVPVFDPGLSEEAENYEEEGVWPELRRAEANRFAYKLRTALQDTGAFGAVRVTPDSTGAGDLYVLGRILESNGEDVEIRVEVRDISGREWFTRDFDHTVSSGFHKNIRNEGKDSYDPVFEEAANRIVHELDDYSSAELETLSRLADLSFGASFAEGAFTEHMEIDGDEVSLVSFPAVDDPMLRRTQAIRVRDQLFVDGLQEHYSGFASSMQDSYLIWQEQSLLEQEARREANMEAIGKAVLGVLAIGVAVAAVAAGANSNSVAGETAGVAGGAVAGVVGAGLLASSFQTSEEAKVHREALAELGQSMDLELGPRVVAFEEETVELTGNAKEQFAQWRQFLLRIFEEEATPEAQL